MSTRAGREEHHRLWYDDIAAGKIPAQRTVRAGRAGTSSPPPESRGASDASFHRRRRRSPSRLLAGAALAKLPPLSDEAKAKAAEAAAKAAWTDKVGAYQLCQSMDKVAAGLSRRSPWRRARRRRRADADAGVRRSRAPSCAPVTPAASKPLEASGAHSPPGHGDQPAEQQGDVGRDDAARASRPSPSFA